jgi:hypothetical protein
MEGILRNWRRTGHAMPKLKSEADRDAREARSLKAEGDRAATVRRAEDARKAFELVEQVLATLPERELALLKAEAEIECDQEGIPGVVRDAMVTSKVRKSVAKKFGIQGL